MPPLRCFMAFSLPVMLAPGAAIADWKAAGPDVEAASHEPEVAAVLATVDRMDRALITDDHATFSALLADDLVVNNPQNTLSRPGATMQRNAAGKISYTAYDRTIDYAGRRGDMVLLMGEERCVPKAPNPMAGQVVHRRFTDLWKRHEGRWLLTARQATIVAPR